MHNNTHLPKADKIPHVLSAHGHARTDPYYWLSERGNPKVMAYLREENRYANSVLAHTKPFQEALFKEIKSRMKEADVSVPYLQNNHYLYHRFVKGLEYPVYCRRAALPKGRKGPEEVLLDTNELAAGLSYLQVMTVSSSPDNRYLAFTSDAVGRRRYTLKFKDLTTGMLLPEEISGTRGGVVWANNSKTVFYTCLDPLTLRPCKVYRYELGSPVSTAELVYEETDPAYHVSLGKSKTWAYIYIASEATLSTEFRLLDADRPHGSFEVFQPRLQGLEYYVYHHGERFYVLTNHQAPDFRLTYALKGSTALRHWQQVCSPQNGVLLENVEVFKDYLVLQERTDGLVRLQILPQDGSPGHYLDFGEPTYEAYLGHNHVFESKTLRYGYSSLTTPKSVYDYRMDTRKKTLKKRMAVLGGFLPGNYQAERLHAKAPDGTEIPISLVYRKGLLKKNGENPLYLTGYGAYGVTNEANFHPAGLSLLDRGVVFAIAHVRGGQELGRHWYDAGRLLNKKNTFSDFIACAEYLTAQGFTSKNKLIIQGGSAGGLLVGAVANLRPDLCRAILAEVPFVDVVTTMLNPDIPLTTAEYGEWGNPADKTYYDYMLSYSPYDNVKAQQYPDMLVTGALHDSQVQYWEPAKWVAKLRDHQQGAGRILLKTDLHAGHSGSSGRFARFRELAFEYAFVFDLLGIAS